MSKDDKKLSPQQQLSNVWDSLADDYLAGHIDTDEETNKRAERIVRDALDSAPGSGDGVNQGRKRTRHRRDGNEPSGPGRSK
jgi:hypothetical protein